LNPEKPIWPRGKPGYVRRVRNLDLFRTVVMFSFHPNGNTFQFDRSDDGRLVIHRTYVSGLKDEDMAWVTKLVNLRSLWLEANGITDEGMIQLSNLKRLEILWLQHTPISDKGIPALAKLTKLRDLDRSATDVTDESIEALSQCRALQILKLLNTNISDTGVATLQRALPDCVIRK
jgi:hypothetical protein